jgi:hypothetical protein
MNFRSLKGTKCQLRGCHFTSASDLLIEHGFRSATERRFRRTFPQFVEIQVSYFSATKVTFLHISGTLDFFLKFPDTCKSEATSSTIVSRDDVYQLYNRIRDTLPLPLHLLHNTLISSACWLSPFLQVQYT